MSLESEVGQKQKEGVDAILRPCVSVVQDEFVRISVPSPLSPFSQTSLETLATQWIDPRLERVHNENKGSNDGEVPVASPRTKRADL